MTDELLYTLSLIAFPVVGLAIVHFTAWQADRDLARSQRDREDRERLIVR